LSVALQGQNLIAMGAAHRTINSDGCSPSDMRITKTALKGRDENYKVNNEINIRQTVDQIIAEKGKERKAVIPILQAIQNTYNYLPEESLKYVCEKTEITPEQIVGVASFYSQFRMKPVGEHIIKVCVGTACHVKGAGQVYDALRRHFNLTGHEETDASRKYTIEKVSCLGCCTLAPVVQIDEITYGHVASDKVGNVLADFEKHVGISGAKKAILRLFCHWFRPTIRNILKRPTLKVLPSLKVR